MHVILNVFFACGCGTVCANDLAGGL